MSKKIFTFFFLSQFLSISIYSQSPWTQRANYGGAVRAYDVAFSIGHYGFVGCGVNPSNYLHDFWKYDQYTDTWTAISDYPGQGQFGCIGFTIEGKGYVGCGWNGSVSTNDFWEYDTITNAWTEIATFPGTGRYSSFPFVIGHKAYLVGGCTGGPPYLQDAWVYDAHANTWTQLSDFPEGDIESYISFAIGNHGYVGNGFWNPGCYQQMYEYDTTTNTWSTSTNIPISYGITANPTPWVVGSKAYLSIGSVCTSEGLRDGWVYDTVTNSWCEYASMASAKISRGMAVAFTLNNQRYLCTGLDTNSNYLRDLWEYTPSTKINVTDTNLCGSDSVHFSDSSSYYATGWNWSFPGGIPATSALQTPLVYYSSSGTYTAKLILAACGGGDTVTRNITITGGGGLVTINGKSPICAGTLDTITVMGGTNYAWSNGATTNSIIISPLSSTTYSVYVTGGCVNKDTTVNIIVNPLPVVALSGNNVLCAGDTTTLLASGGISYLWSMGATSSSIVVTPPTTTIYTVVVSNANCSKDTGIEVTVNPLPVASVSGNSPICKGDSATLIASGGSKYLWNTGQTSDYITVIPSNTTVYVVYVINSFGCIADTSYQVNVEVPDGAITGPSSLCYGDSITLIASGGGTYKWNTGATTDSIRISPAVNTSYHVIVSNGCIDTVSTTVSVDNPGLYACCDTTIFIPGTDVILEASGVKSYYWTPPVGIICDSCPTPIVAPDITTIYTVTGTDSAGCKISRMVIVTVEVSNCLSADIPNIFTPNGDGINDEFVVDLHSVSDYSISIFDRWGNEIYKSVNPTVYWNGTNQNDNSFVSDGVYYYILKYTCYNKSYNKDGYIEVLR